MKKKPVIRRQVPKHIAAAQVFQPLYRILKDLKGGEVLEAENKVIMSINPAFAEFRDTLFPAANYIKEWCRIWNEISVQSGQEIPTASLIKLADTLSIDCEVIEVEERLIDEAKSELDTMRTTWLKLPKNIIDRALAAAN